MELKTTISNIKNITSCEFSLPIEKGIYCLAGANGCGKSTVLSCVAQCLFKTSLRQLNEYDYGSDSSVAFSFGTESTVWRPEKTGYWSELSTGDDCIRFNGMYEGSLFYGTRFADSLIVDDLVKNSKINITDIVDADIYVKDQLSYILHGDKEHYRKLKRVRNKRIAQSVNLRNTPYFQEVNGHLISQYRMSSGECLLVSLLHFIYNALIRRSLPIDQPVLMLIDEIELALHPVAVSRLIDLLKEIIVEHDNLTVLLTSHSPEVIRKISPSNLIMMETNADGTCSFFSPCYPSYAIRDVYMHSGFDYVVLVEDLLAKYFVEKTIQENRLNSGKLINVLPIGGWQNVLKFQMMAYNTNTFGIGAKLFSILDGDIENEANKLKEYARLPKMFLPISSIEKYLLKVCTEGQYKDVKRAINDAFFNVDKMEDIFSENVKSNDNSGKRLYKSLIENLSHRRISEDAFVKGLSEIIIANANTEKFVENLKTYLQ